MVSKSPATGKRSVVSAGRLVEFGEKIIERALEIDEAALPSLTLASLTLERVARIAGMWPEKSAARGPAAVPPEPQAQPEVVIYSAEPLTEEQWLERFKPKDA